MQKFILAVVAMVAAISVPCTCGPAVSFPASWRQPDMVFLLPGLHRSASPAPRGPSGTAEKLHGAVT